MPHLICSGDLLSPRPLPPSSRQLYWDLCSVLSNLVCRSEFCGCFSLPESSGLEGTAEVICSPPTPSPCPKLESLFQHPCPRLSCPSCIPPRTGCVLSIRQPHRCRTAFPGPGCFQKGGTHLGVTPCPGFLCVFCLHQVPHMLPLASKSRAHGMHVLGVPRTTHFLGTLSMQDMSFACSPARDGALAPVPVPPAATGVSANLETSSPFQPKITSCSTPFLELTLPSGVPQSKQNASLVGQTFRCLRTTITSFPSSMPEFLQSSYLWPGSCGPGTYAPPQFTTVGPWVWSLWPWSEQSWQMSPVTAAGACPAASPRWLRLLAPQESQAQNNFTHSASQVDNACRDRAPSHP